MTAATATLARREPGRLMTKYYLKFNTMKNIVQAPESCSLEDVLHIVCRSEEISWIQLRRNEKKLLNDINCDKDGRLRFHVLAENGKRKKRIQTSEEKIFVLANDCLTGDPLIHDLSLSQDTNSMCSNGCRIAKCMKECFVYRKSYKGALNSTLLAKCLDQRLWENSPYLLKQLPGIGMVTAKALHSMGVDSFETMAEADPRRIEMITGRKYPFGNHIKESLLSLPPKVEMKIAEAECKGLGKSKLIISLARVSQSTSHKRHYADMVVGSEEDNLILFHQKIRVEEFLRPSFDLLQEEESLIEGLTDQEHGETEVKPLTEQSVFDHIRNKSKNFPVLLTSKSMDSSYVPLILKRRRTLCDQYALDPAMLHKETVILTDSDSESPRRSPVSSSTKNFPTVLERKKHDPFTPRSIIQALGLPTKSISITGDATENCKSSNTSDSAADFQRQVDPLCFSEAADKQKDASFLGFKSVFSFLW